MPKPAMRTAKVPRVVFTVATPRMAVKLQAKTLTLPIMLCVFQSSLFFKLMMDADIWRVISKLALPLLVHQEVNREPPQPLAALHLRKAPMHGRSTLLTGPPMATMSTTLNVGLFPTPGLILFY